LSHTIKTITAVRFGGSIRFSNRSVLFQKTLSRFKWDRKREELIATNSMILHEFYFGNLGGDGKSSGTVSKLINAHYGSLGIWEQDFRRTGMSLGGGSGWAILNYNYRENAVHNY
jgi:superoxide dismutase